MAPSGPGVCGGSADRIYGEKSGVIKLIRGQAAGGQGGDQRARAGDGLDTQARGDGFRGEPLGNPGR